MYDHCVGVYPYSAEIIIIIHIFFHYEVVNISFVKFELLSFYNLKIRQQINH